MNQVSRKRLVFCFDGTSNTLERAHPTNVAITAASVRNSSGDMPQIVYYDEGVGSNKNDTFRGGALGVGLYDKVVEAYKFLVFNHEPQDEIFIFGFSRGAYTARSFAGLLHHTGIVNSTYADKIHVAATLYQNRRRGGDEPGDDVFRFRAEFVTDTCANDDDLAWRRTNKPGFDPEGIPLVRIRYIGVWDTVKTIGSTLISGDRDGDGEADDAAFHDHDLHPSVQAARHAVAIDERRGKFNVTLWANVDRLNQERGFAVDALDRPYQQLWFPGTHGSVGGGGDVRGLSDESLEWVLDGAKEAGLKLDSAPISRVWGIRPDPLAQLDNAREPGWSPKEVLMRNLPPLRPRKGPEHLHEVSRAAIVRWAAPDAFTPEQGPYRPRTLDRVSLGMEEAARAYEPWMYETRGGYTDNANEQLPDLRRAGRTFRRHVIAPGETLTEISTRYLGHAKRLPDIVAANRTTIIDPDRYYAGQIINIPAADG